MCVRTEKIPLYTQQRPGEAPLCAFRLYSESSAGKGKPRAVTGSPISRTCLQSQLYFWNNPMGFNFFRKLKRNPARPVFSLIVPDPDKPSLLLPVPPLPLQRPDCGECVTWPPSFRASRGIPYTPRTRGWGAAQRLHPEGDRVSLISSRGPSSADTSSQCVRAQWLHSVRCFAAPWTASCRAPLTVGFSRQGYWSTVPFPPQGIFPTQGSNLRSSRLLRWQVDSLHLVPPGQFPQGPRCSRKARRSGSPAAETLLDAEQAFIPTPSFPRP